MEISNNINPKDKNNLNKSINNINDIDINYTNNQINLNYKYYESLEISDLYLCLKKIIDNNIIPQIIPVIKIIQKIIKNKIQIYREKTINYYHNNDKEINNKELLNVDDWEQKFKKIFLDFRKKNQLFYEERDKKFKQNLEKRKKIINELKKLYTSPYETNNQIFKKFREIKSNWHHAGIVSKNVVDTLFKTYFHHLENFYAYLNLNKELQAMDYAHNLEQRKIIINRAKDLLNKKNLFEALNELQYLHKLWKEEAEPVEEKYKESTWIEFKEITNQIHAKKNNWIIENQKKELKNLENKKKIINKLKKIVSTENNYLNHNILQENIKKIDLFRKDFVKIGKIPKEHNDIIWIEFKNILKTFTNKKNQFYKNQKNEQHNNLEKKNQLINIANSHKNSQDWLYSLEILKKIQNEWKEIGYVPKKISDKKWEEFKSACDYFFKRYKNQHQEYYDQFKKNLDLKNLILQKLNKIKDNKENQILSTIENIKKLNQEWNQIGKVPRENIEINSHFHKICNEILYNLNIDQKTINQIQIQLQFENIISSKDQQKLNEELKKIKKQIQELENHISILDNNLSFFKNTNKNNPLIKNVYQKLENKKEKLQYLIKKFNTLSRLDLSN